MSLATAFQCKKKCSWINSYSYNCSIFASNFFLLSICFKISFILGWKYIFIYNKSLLFKLKQRQVFRWSTCGWSIAYLFPCWVPFFWSEFFLIEQRLYCQDLWLLKPREDRNEWIASNWVSCFFFFSLPPASISFLR